MQLKQPTNDEYSARTPAATFPTRRPCASEIGITFLLSAFLIGVAVSWSEAQSFDRPIITNLQRLNMPVNDVVFVRHSNMLYVTVPGSGGAYANSLVEVDSRTGAIQNSYFVGGEPTYIALSDAEKYIYVYLSGTNQVARFNISTRMIDSDISFRKDRAVSELLPVPGSPESVFVVQYVPGLDPDDAESAIYDNGIPRPASCEIGDFATSSFIPGRIYTHSETYEFRRDGLVQVGHWHDYDGMDSGFVSENGLIFTNYGKVIDPESRAEIGSFDAFDSGVATFSDVGYLYVFDDDKVKLLALKTLTQVATQTSYNLPAVPTASPQPNNAGIHPRSPGSTPTAVYNPLEAGFRPYRVLRWGVDGLAWVAKNRLTIAHSPYLRDTVPHVDLSVQRKGLPDIISDGDEHKYTITVKNSSSNTATGVMLSEKISNHFDVVSVSTSAGSASVENGIISANLGDMRSLNLATLTVSIRARDNGVALATAVVRALQPDGDPADNIAEQNVTASVPPAPRPVWKARVDPFWPPKTVAQPSTKIGNDNLETISVAKTAPTGEIPMPIDVSGFNAPLVASTEGLKIETSVDPYDNCFYESGIIGPDGIARKDGITLGKTESQYLNDVSGGHTIFDLRADHSDINGSGLLLRPGIQLNRDPYPHYSNGVPQSRHTCLRLQYFKGCDRGVYTAFC